MRSILGSILSIAISIYIMAASICGLWFNYDYAKKHGFVEWFFFGEVVATAKAIVWPYYVYKGYNQKKEQDNYENYDEVANAFSKEQLADMTATVWTAVNPDLTVSKECLLNQLTKNFSKEELKMIVYARTEQEINKVTKILQQKQSAIAVCILPRKSL